MKSRNLSRHLAAGLLLGAAALGLAGCSLPGTGPQEGSGEWNTLFQVHPLEGFEQADGSFQVRDASGQTVAVMAADDALRDYPARSPVEEGAEKAFPRTLWGTAPDGTQWAVTWSGPSAGVSQCRALLSRDGGETWTLTPSYPSLVSDVYGAGFLSEQVGFVCSRHFLTSGPEVLWTRDGGEHLGTAGPPDPGGVPGTRDGRLQPPDPGRGGLLPGAGLGGWRPGGPVHLLQQHRPGALDLVGGRPGLGLRDLNVKRTHRRCVLFYLCTSIRAKARARCSFSSSMNGTS